MVSIRDKELIDLKDIMKQSKKMFYNMGFTDLKIHAALSSLKLEGWDLCRVGWKLWMPSTSPRLLHSEILPKYHCPMILPFKLQPMSNLPKEEMKGAGEYSPNMRELAEQINSHIELVD